MLTGRVQASDRYIATGSASLRPEGPCHRRARRGDDRVEARRPDRVEVALDQRADLLGLQVVGVVVAGRERVGAEHDPALHLARRSRCRASQVVGEDVRRRRRDVAAVADAVVAREVRASPRPARRCSRWRGRSRCAAGRPRRRRAGRLEVGDCLADARLDARIHARHEVLARQPIRLPAQRRRRLVVAIGQRRGDRPGTGSGADVASRSSRPATAWSSSAASRTSRANGPIWSRLLANATIP